MRNLRRRLIFIIGLLAIFTAGAISIRSYLQERALHALPYGFTKFNPDDSPPLCSRWKDYMPAKRDPAAYRLYMEARKLWRSKIGWQLTHAEAMRILTDVSKAAEMGDWGARSLMAHFYLYGLGVLDSNHVLDPAPEKAVALARMAAEAGQPWGLFDLGVAYENGYGGVPYDMTLAWAYYLRAAQRGSPDAQMTLATAYTNAGRRVDAEAMMQCAYQQGHGPAAQKLAIRAKLENRYVEAFRLYQEGVKFGSRECAASLELLFSDGHGPSAPEDRKSALKLLGIRADPERERRYNAIYDALTINPDLRLMRLDRVLPLPPADLPSWSSPEDAVEPDPSGPPTY